MKIKMFLTVISGAVLSACSPSHPAGIQEQTLRAQIGNLHEQIAICDLQLQIYDLQGQICGQQEQIVGNKKDLNAQIAQIKEDNRRAEAEAAAARRRAGEAKKIVPQNLTIKAAPCHSAVLRVNILLVDDYGRVPECFKGVAVSDITQNGKHTHFLFDGKPIDWNQKVVYSYSYTDNEAPITGTIYYTPEIAGAASKVINIQPRNVYQDSDGTIRYDDGAGRFPRAPKGAGYITTQSVLPTQP